jgi:hypothetical protein
MKNQILLLLFTFALVSFSDTIHAQKIDKQSTYTISSKSKKGTLGNAEYDVATGTYVLTYVTKANDKKAKFEIYHFDNNFQFIQMEEDIIEFEKAKTKYKWFNFNGELYSVEGVFVQPNLTGTLILKKKLITYKYDWFLLGYHKKVDVLKKVKPKTEDGRKFYYITHAEDDITGETLILAGIKDAMKKGADPYRHFKDLVVLKFDYDLNMTGETSVKFDYPQSLAFAGYMDGDGVNFGVGGMSFIFAPMGGMGMNKAADPDNTNYTYVSVDKDAKLIDKISFNSPSSYWQINEMIYTKNGNVYFYGPAAAGKDKYFNASTTTKFKAVQLMKVSNHEIDYLTETDLEEFEAKLKTPPSQKKSPAYKGKKFGIAGYKIGSNGDFYVMGQNFSTSNNGNQYKDIVGFHFDNKGKLKSQYGIDTKESNATAKSMPVNQDMIESNDGSKMYWMILELKGVNKEGYPLMYPRVGSISVNSGEISDFMDIGAIEKDQYYLDPKFPYLETVKGNSITFFGSDKKGKEIWFARILFD